MSHDRIGRGRRHRTCQGTFGVSPRIMWPGLPMTRHPILLLALVAIAGCRPERGVALEECVPGETLIVACAEGCGLGSCSGDPVLRVCDGALGTSACRASMDRSEYLEVDDTSCGGLCPRVRVTCPASGSVAITTRGYANPRCDLDTDHLGIRPPGGRAAETISCTPGAPTEIGCALGCGLGECNGNVAIRVCDGTTPIDGCVAGSPLIIDENSSSANGCDDDCPQLVVTCPASGSLTVVPRQTGGTAADFLCDWTARPAPHRSDATEVCSPGSRLIVGCAAACGIGSCAGDGSIRVCDGNTTPDACRALTSGATGIVGENARAFCSGDAPYGDCPQTEAVCPSSGAITVVSYPQYEEDEGFGCDWAVRAAGLGE